MHARLYCAGVVGLSGIATDPPSAEPAVLGGHQPHSHVPCYAAVPNTAIAAVCDVSDAALEKFRQEWGDRWPSYAAFQDYREMLRTVPIDLLSVVTPDHLHADIVVEAVRAGVRGIFCEKPIATTLRDADRMIAAVEAADVPMIINHTRRWYGDYHRAWNLIREGAIGRVTHVHAVCGGPRAMLFRNGTHLIDLAVWYADSEPEWVVAQLDPGHEMYGPRYAGDGGRDPAKDPGGRAQVRFANGVVASIFCSKLINSQSFLWELTIYGERGQIRITEPGGLALIMPSGDLVRGLAEHRLTSVQYAKVDGVAAITELIDLMEQRGHGRQGQSPPRAARHVLAILLAILQSQAHSNQPVTAPFTDEA